MSILAPFKRLILRAVLRNVSPMVIRILAVPDSLLLHEFDPSSAPSSVGITSASFVSDVYLISDRRLFLLSRGSAGRNIQWFQGFTAISTNTHLQNERAFL